MLRICPWQFRYAELHDAERGSTFDFSSPPPTYCRGPLSIQWQRGLEADPTSSASLGWDARLTHRREQTVLAGE
ncbi:MAG: hypothetical protein ACQEQT_04975 [Chloroflexota bacterium]